MNFISGILTVLLVLNSVLLILLVLVQLPKKDAGAGIAFGGGAADALFGAGRMRPGQNYLPGNLLAGFGLAVGLVCEQRNRDPQNESD